jgi:branched-chain amino acid transport system permease protein
MFQRWRESITPTDIVMWLIGGTLLVMIIWGSVATLAAGKIIFGLAQGSVYALIATGYTMVYGVLKMINFAHGEVFMSGPYTAYFVAAAMYRTDFLDKHPFTALFVIFVVAMAISTIIAYFLEKIAYRPLRGAPRLIPLITAIGASFFLQYMFRGLYGSGFQAYPNIKMLEGFWFIFGIRILKIQVVVILAAIFLMAALYGFIMLTRGGKAIRAISEDKEASSLMGINVDGMISTTFVIGGMSAGAAGVLYALMFKQVHFFMGCSLCPHVQAGTLFHGIYSRNQGLYRGSPGRYRQHPRGHVGRDFPGSHRVGWPQSLSGRSGNRRPIPAKRRHCLHHAGPGAYLQTHGYYG